MFKSLSQDASGCTHLPSSCCRCEVLHSACHTLTYLFPCWSLRPVTHRRLCSLRLTVSLLVFCISLGPRNYLLPQMNSGIGSAPSYLDHHKDPTGNCFTNQFPGLYLGSDFLSVGPQHFSLDTYRENPARMLTSRIFLI